MDKVRLIYNIARIKKQLFSVIAFIGFLVVTIATIVGHGFDTYKLFINSTISILVFGGLGYVIGFIYNWIIEEPLIESYRMEAQQRIEQLKSSGPQRVVMELGVGDIQPGMKSVDAVQSKDGALLVRAGAVINERIIRVLQENNIAKIKIEGQRNIPTEADMAKQMSDL